MNSKLAPATSKLPAKLRPRIIAAIECSFGAFAAALARALFCTIPNIAPSIRNSQIRNS